ncbi:MAG: DoxX family protein [Chitinophagaceae bacterium]|nr:DoxX family protein [Chitinophagaceae bacterium]
MKAAVTTARIIVGLLFIFSGLVKANDPLGLSYKMQEFFDLWGMSEFNSWTLLMSVLMNAFEIIAGFALLLGWRIKLFSWLLLLLIIFFTFLTGYAYLSGKFKNCGCFGDCLPITPFTSFLKDLLLLALIIFIFWKRKLIKPLFQEKATTISMFVITVLSFGVQWYALTYLPFVDCLPFKKGKNITKQMEMPANAVPDRVIITYEYLKDATVSIFPIDSVPKELNKKEFLFVKKDSTEVDSVTFKKIMVYRKAGTGVSARFTSEKFPDDFTTSNYKYILLNKDEDKIEGKNNQPPIKGFDLKGVTGEDSTGIILNQPYAVLLFCENFSVPVSKWEKCFSKLFTELKAKNIPAYLVTSRPGEAGEKISKTPFAGLQILTCDYTAIKTAARTNPCIYFLKAGTIVDKQSFRKLNSIIAAVKKLP